jgi:hypothetical protein
MTGFVIAVKSTIDKLGVDLVTTLNALREEESQLDYVDLDDATNIASIIEGSTSAIVWQLNVVIENPVHPLYDVVFTVGAKTVVDPGNYELLSLVDSIKESIPLRSFFPILDYSTEDEPTVVAGDMYITGMNMEPHEFDRQAGFRLLTFTAKAKALSG